MFRPLRLALPLACAIYACSSYADDHAATKAAPQAAVSASPAEHRLAVETQKMRQHHLQRIDDKLHAEPHALQTQCKYESEISTKPPQKQVVLTFDDGPQAEQTDFILDVLKRHKIVATFFVVGEKAEKHPDILSRLTAAGHIVGNHSWDHPNFHDLTPMQQETEIMKTGALLSNTIGAPKFFRYPYGNSSCASNELLHTHAYSIVGWHIDSCDWAFDHNGSVDAKEALSCGVLAQNRSHFVDHVVSTVRAHNGGILLLHENHPHTLRQLETIITRLEGEGYVFSSLAAPAFAASLR